MLQVILKIQTAGQRLLKTNKRIFQKLPLQYLYRLCKIMFYTLVYKTFIYKYFYPHDISTVYEPQKKYRLVVCHNGGGGTVSYMKNKYSGQKNIIYLRNTITADKDYLYSLENSETGIKVYIQPQQIQQLNHNIEAIHVIAVESYMNLYFILNWFSSLRVPLEYDLHDYHCIWYETHFIHNGKYLTKEDLQKSLLKYGKTVISFSQWHQIWENFFPYVNKINAFSNSSKEIFKEYYPQFADKVVVTPHALDYINCGKLKKIPAAFNIGIFGLIYGPDKGCDVVHSFLDFSRNKDYQIYINGDLNESCKVEADNIHYMGRYKVSELDKIIEEQGISAVLFPSICPETFSYTVSELIHVGIPVACFNLGAQAEKIKGYKYGEIIKDYSNQAVLEALKAAYKKGQKEA